MDRLGTDIARMGQTPSYHGTTFKLMQTIWPIALGSEDIDRAIKPTDRPKEAGYFTPGNVDRLFSEGWGLVFSAGLYGDVIHQKNVFDRDLADFAGNHPTISGLGGPELWAVAVAGLLFGGQ